TLSVLDHYIERARADAKERPEALALVSRATGAYFGEVVRRRHASWWNAAAEDPAEWRLEFEEVYLAFAPVPLMADALQRADDEPVDDTDGHAGFELLEEDRDAAKARLAQLPDVSPEEFYAPSTRLEVIDITVEAIRARKIAAGEIA